MRSTRRGVGAHAQAGDAGARGRAALGIQVGTASAQDNQNCADFASQAAAQAHLRADASDPDRLDTDRDGVACETHAYAAGSPREEASVGVSVRAHSDSIEALASSGAGNGTVPLAFFGAVLLLAGAWLTAVGRRAVTDGSLAALKRIYVRRPY